MEPKGRRLQVVLSHAGIASRRAAEAIIAEGRVSVNGAVVAAQGSKVFPGDAVLVDGRPVHTESRRLYIALNKPPGYICSSADPQGRPLALDLLPAGITERLYSVGRLDFLSCGLIFFTNDGDFASRLGHPRCGMEKEYLVEATGHIPDEALRAFEEGIEIEGEHYRALRAARVSSRCIKVVLVEGKNREIRRVFSHFHLHPDRLRRIRIGCVKLGGLPEGASKPLAGCEVEALIKGSGEWGAGNRDGDSSYRGAARKRAPHSPPSPPQRGNTW